MDEDVRERLERIEARIDELAAMITDRPVGADGSAGAPAEQCVAERCMHPGEPLTDANSMTVHPKGPDGEADRTSTWPIHRACLSPARHAVT